MIQKIHNNVIRAIINENNTVIFAHIRFTDIGSYYCEQYLLHRIIIELEDSNSTKPSHKSNLGEVSRSQGGLTGCPEPEDRNSTKSSHKSGLGEVSRGQGGLTGRPEPEDRNSTKSSVIRPGKG